MRILFAALIVITTLSSSPFSKADNAASLDSVVVTATRTETSLGDLPVPVVVIDRSTIERNAGASLPDLLRFAAGIDIAQSGGPGQLATAFIRGTESDHVLVLVDGVELSPGSLGTPQLQNIDPAIIERIEIVKGPRSALYGSEAVGGVINIITRRDAESFRAHIGGGSFGTREFGAGARTGSGSTSVNIDIAHRESDGFPPRASSDIDRGHENTTANLAFRTALGPLDVTLRHFRSEGTTEYLGVFLDPVSQDFDNRVSELKFDWHVADWRSQLSISNAKDMLAQNGAASFAETDRRVVDWQNDIALDAHTLTAGVYLENEDVVAENFGRTEADTDVRALYLQEQWQGENLHILVAMRGTDHERFGNASSWNMDAGWTLTDALSLRLNTGRAFRAPNATFLYGPFAANPDLEPEVSLNRELGLEWQPTEDQQFTFAVFDNRIDDMIDYDPVNITYENIAEVRIRGVEFAHEWRADRWHGRTSVVLQKPENDLTKEPLLRRAEESLTVSVTRSFERVDVGIDLLANGERADIDADAFAHTVNPGYVLLNLTANWLIDEKWSLAGRIENLLDTEYQTAAGYNTAERGAFVTLRYSH